MKKQTVTVNDLSIEDIECLLYDIIDFDEIPPPIDVFLSDPYYLGNYFGENGCLPYWCEKFQEIFPSTLYSPYFLIVLRGAIGIGKTTAACIGLLYDACRLLCMKNPQEYYNLVPSTQIVFALMNVTTNLATSVIWQKIEEMIKSSQFFQKWLNTEFVSRQKSSYFKKNITFHIGSRVTHTLGKAIFSCLLDESNFEIQKGQVEESFFSLIRRMESRFMSETGVPGRVWLVSSETEKQSLVDTIQKSFADHPGLFVAADAIWQVHREKYKTDKFFKVFIGEETKPPEIVHDSHPYVTEYPDKIIEVPIMLYDSFNNNIHKALRDLAGVATTTNYNLFRHREKLYATMIGAQIFPEVIRLDFDDETKIEDFLVIKDYFSHIPNPDKPRYIHIDIGLSNDKLGFACAYVSGKKPRTYINPITLTKIEEILPSLHVEFAFAVEAIEGKQIPLYKIRLFILYLSSMHFPIAGISFDGFQSADMMQLLERQGFNVQLLSVDRDFSPYENLKDAVYDDRILIPNNNLLKKELVELVKNEKKIDHPAKGSKDVADAVAGAVYQATKNFDVNKFFTDSATSQNNVTNNSSILAELFYGDETEDIFTSRLFAKNEETTTYFF